MSDQLQIPLVSAVCSTFCRPKQLAEALWCFLEQDYPNKELLIINDAVHHPVVLDAAYPGVRVFNVESRFDSLGSKRNFGLSLIEGEYYCLWEDDDLSLPWRMTDSVAWLTENPSASAVNPLSCLYSVHNADYNVISSNLEGQTCFHSRHFLSTRYPEDKSLEMDLDFQENALLARPDVGPTYWYIYRWGMNVYHLSGRGEESPDVWKEAGYMSALHCGDMPTIGPSPCNKYFQDADLFLSEFLPRSDYEQWQQRICPWL